jgi:hypothetical protein
MVIIVIIMQRILGSWCTRHTYCRGRSGSSDNRGGVFCHGWFRDNGIAIDIGMSGSQFVHFNPVFFIADSFILWTFGHGK